MDRNSILTELNKIIEYVLDLDDLNLTEEDKVRGIEDWDSIMHVEIIVQIEEQFDIKFKTLEIEKFVLLKDMVTSIGEKLNLAKV